MKIRKPGVAFLILIMLSALYVAVIFLFSYKDIYEREQKRNDLKNERIKQMLNLINVEFSEEYDRHLNRNEVVVRLMSLMLSEYVVNGEYNGPLTFDDGFVVRVTKNKIFYPEDSKYDLDMDPSFFESEFSNGTADLLDSNGNLSQYIFNIAKIAGPYYYVDLTSVKDLSDSVDLTVPIDKTISDIESTYGCRLIIVNKDKNDPKSEIRFFVYPSEPQFSEEVTPESLGITNELLSEKPSIMEYDGKEYFSTFLKYSFLGYDNTVIILNDAYNHTFQTIDTVILFATLLLIISVSVIMWIYWVQTYVRDNVLLASQVQRLRPDVIRKRVVSILLIGGIGIFLLALFYQTLSNLRWEATSNQESMEAVIKRLNDNNANVSGRQLDEEGWSVFLIKRIASVLENSRSLRTDAYLEKINELISSEYMMLFDSEGKEYASSNGVIGYSLLETESLANYRDLLNGLDTFVGDPIRDLNDRKSVQLIGTPVFNPETNNYDVLLMAIDAENTWQIGNERSIQSVLENATPAGKLCVVIDKNKNRVAYASEPVFIDEILPGMKYQEGDPESSGLDTYMVDNQRYYGGYDSNQKYVVYYLTEESFVRGSSFLFALIAAFGYAAVIFILAGFMLYPYTKEQFKAVVRVKESTHISQEDLQDNIFEKNNEDDGEKSFKQRWKELVPKKKVHLLLQILLGIVLLISVIFYIQIRNRTSLFADLFNTNSTVNFIISGNWKRGFNLLGIAGAMIVLLGFAVFVFIKSVLLQVLCSVLDSKGVTICRLTFSLMQYGAVIGGIYLIMGFLGFNTTFQLTSIGIVSLAISLGSKDIVADILAGIFIIFEDDFQVGDFVEINGFSGIVQEIGVRSTKVLGLGDNIKIIGNQDVKNVINKSKQNTWLTLEFKLPPDVPLLEVERLLTENMHEFGTRIPEIIGPYYKGVWGINDFGKKIIHVSCECTEMDSRTVTRKLTHEVIVLLESNGIKMG